MSEILPHEAQMIGGYRPINNAPEMEIGQSKQLIAANMVGVDDPAGGSGERWVTLIRPVACSSQGAWVYTVAMGVTGEGPPVDPEAGSREAGLLGQVKWGVGGARYTVVFDLRVGTMLTVLGSSLEVAAGYSIITGNVPREATVAAGLAHGPRPGCCYLTRTFPAEELGGEGGSVRLYPVPAFAYAVQVFASTNTVTDSYAAGAFTVDMFGGPDPALSEQYDSVDAPTLLAAHNTEGYKLNNQTRWLRLTADNIAEYTVSFVIGL